MKNLIALLAVIGLVGCVPKVVHEETYRDTVVVTEFVKRHKRQRIKVITSDGILINQYVAKRCSGCYAYKGDKFSVTVTKKTWDDGGVTYSINRYETKEFLRK
ncbi:hypothetical protein [Aeromonas phage AS-yj]|uniref:Lipoprotein n=1 Tax=Aeromonas phage AS-yj TaxID=2026115 RepID=A0A291LFK5_9CAUD|nr:hypothetical protein [Aeromonas phage AS-yj]